MDRFRSPSRILDFGRSLAHRDYNETIPDRPHHLKSMTLRSDTTTENVPYSDKRNSQEMKTEMEISDNNKPQSDTNKLQNFIDSMDGHFSKHNRKKRPSTSTSWQAMEPKMHSTNHSELIDLSNKHKDNDRNEIQDLRRKEVGSEEKHRMRMMSSKVEETDSDGDQLDDTSAKTNLLNNSIKNGLTNPATGSDGYMNYSFYPHDIDPTSHFLNRGLHPLTGGAMFNHLGYPGMF